VMQVMSAGRRRLLVRSPTTSEEDALGRDLPSCWPFPRSFRFADGGTEPGLRPGGSLGGSQQSEAADAVDVCPDLRSEYTTAWALFPSPSMMVEVVRSLQGGLVRLSIKSLSSNAELWSSWCPPPRRSVEEQSCGPGARLSGYTDRQCGVPL
jgi:hypothetical protein